MVERHAPGPWSAMALTVVDAGGTPIAEIISECIDERADTVSRRDFLNAALITAAPKLLAALREARDLLEPLDPEYRQQVDRWADVLAEAEGRRP